MLQTNRLTIKSISETESDALLEIVNNATVKKTYMIPDFPTKEKAMELVHRIISNSQSAEHYVRGIFLQNQLIGFVNDVEISETFIEIGYVIHPIYHNQGFASEAIAAIIDELHSMGKDVEAGAFIENQASIRVMEHCGMRRIDKVEQINYRDVMHECIYYRSDCKK